MHLRLACVVALLGSVPAAATDLKLPSQVTPALRAACETDVRRLCIGPNPTVEGVKSCVMARFAQLNRRCQLAITTAGLI